MGGDSMSGKGRGRLTVLRACLATALTCGGLAAVGGPATAAAAASHATAAASPPAVQPRVLLIGQGGSDVTTAAWRAALTSEGVPFTLVIASGTAPDETLSLPPLSSGGTGNYNGVVIA